jgi:hypothetical protein
MSFFVHSAILRMFIVPLLGPMLLNLVIISISLAPVLSFLKTRGQIDLPLIAPFKLVSRPVLLTPFLMPFFLSILILTPFFAVGLFD